MSGSFGRASAQPCLSRASAGPASREPNTTRASRGEFVEVLRGPGGLEDSFAEVGGLVFRGPGGLEVLDGEAAVGRGDDRRRA